MYRLQYVIRDPDTVNAEWQGSPRRKETLDLVGPMRRWYEPFGTISDAVTEWIIYRNDNFDPREPIRKTERGINRRSQASSRCRTQKHPLHFRWRFETALCHVRKRIINHYPCSTIQWSRTRSSQHQTRRWTEFAFLLHFRRLGIKLWTDCKTRAQVWRFTRRTG